MSDRAKQYNSIDVMKFISAILIIILHTSPLASYNKILNYILRNIITIIAVPFFFCASGFLLFEKVNTKEDREWKDAYFKKYAERILIMYAIWTVVYFPFIIYNWVHEGFSLIELLQYIKRIVFVGSYSTIWFLPALLTAAGLCYFMQKKLELKTILIISSFFYAIACAITNYYGLAIKFPLLKIGVESYYSFFETAKNGILFGFIFVVIGGYIAKIKSNKYYGNIQLLILLFVSAVGISIETVECYTLSTVDKRTKF